MKIVASAGREDITIVYIAELEPGKYVEFVEAVQPPIPRVQKWVILVSTLYGCPVMCQMCDAGGYYQGKVPKDGLLAQIDYLITIRYPDRKVPSEQFKIQFARMGEPSFNDSVLDIIEELPRIYHIPGFMPSISTIAPRGRESFFERLLEIKQRQFMAGNFQIQFSIHTTDITLREHLIPIKKWGFTEIAQYGERFWQSGDRKITLNFALAENTPLDPAVLLHYFDNDKFLVKITPLNPTHQANENNLSSYINPFECEREYEVVSALQMAGYQVIVSIGEVEENYIGSNCGQYLLRHLKASTQLKNGYTYHLHEHH